MRVPRSLLLCLMLPGWAGATGVASKFQDPLTFHFESLGSVRDGHGTLDLGRLSARHDGHRMQGVVVRERIALRLDGGISPPASARVWVALGMDVPGVTVRVDGIVVTTMPALIDPVHRVGTRVMHQIELSVPADVPAGAFLHDLRWTAETD